MTIQIDDEKVSVVHTKQNTASRLFQLFTVLNPALHSHTVPQAWVTATGGKTHSVQSELDHEAVRVLKAIGIALNDLTREVKEAGVPDHLWAQHLATLAPLQEPKYLYVERGQTVGRLDSLAMQALQWLAFILPGDRLAADDEDIQQLKERLAALHEALLQPGIPFHLREFAQEQLQTLSDALLLYPIRGIGPLKKAARNAENETQDHMTDLEAQFNTASDKAPSVSVLQRLLGAYKAVRKVTGEVESGVKQAEYLSGKVQQGVQLLENFVDTISQ